MIISAIYKNLLKVFVICLCTVCLNATRVAAESGLGLSPEMQAVRTWFEQKRQSLGINHPTAEEKRQIEAAKKEWDQKSKAMTDDEYQEAVDAWADSSGMAAWSKLNPSSSSDADVIAADSADYVWNEIESYAQNLGGQANDDTDGDGGEPEKFEDIPIGDSTTSTPADATTATAEAPASSGAGPVITPDVPTNITQTVTQNNNGNITQETTSNSVQSTGGAGIGTTADEGDGKAKSDEEQADNAQNNDNKKEEEKAKEEVKYSGMYKDRQLIPDAMAVHCEMNAEDVVKDMSRLEGCIRKYVTDMHNGNASEAAEGKQVYNVLRFNVLSDALKKGIAKAAAVNGYETAMNNYAEASANAETQFDSEANISNTLAFATDVQNSIRDLYVESLRIEAINGFGEVDPASFADEEKSEKAKSVEESEKKSDSNVTNVDTTVEIGGDGEEVDTGGADEDVTEGAEIPEGTEVAGGDAQTGGEDATPQTRTVEPVDENDPVAKELAGRSDEDLKDLYKDVQRDQEELSDTIFKLKQIKEKWQKQNKWTEDEEKRLQAKIKEYKEMQDYQKSIEKELNRRGK